MRRPSPALVVACLALLVALSGTSYATILDVPRNSVGTPELKRNAVKAAKIAPNAVRTGHVLNGSLLVDDFKPGQIPQGPKGDKGDRGEQGAPGISGHEIVMAQSSFDSNPLKSATATCPAGKRALGGGTDIGAQSIPNPVGIGQSRPLGSPANAWIGGWEEEAAYAGSWQVRTYAVCGNVAG